MRGQRPDHGAPQVVADPDCRSRTQTVVKLDHVLEQFPSGHRPRMRPAPKSLRIRACLARRNATLQRRRPRSAHATSGRSRASRARKSSRGQPPARLPVVRCMAGRAEGPGDQGGSFTQIGARPGRRLFRSFESRVRHGLFLHRNYGRWNCTCHVLQNTVRS